MGKKGGGGRVGYGTLSNKGPRNLGGWRGAGRKVRGGNTHDAIQRALGPYPVGHGMSFAHFQRQTGLGQSDALAAIDELVRSGQAQYTFLADNTAAILRGNGVDVVERDGRPVKGFKMLA